MQDIYQTFHYQIGFQEFVIYHTKLISLFEPVFNNYIDLFGQNQISQNIGSVYFYDLLVTLNPGK